MESRKSECDKTKQGHMITGQADQDNWLCMITTIIDTVLCINYPVTIGHCYVEEYPTMHYFGIPRNMQSMKPHKWFWLSIHSNFGPKLHSGNVVAMPYLRHMLTLALTPKSMSFTAPSLPTITLSDLISRCIICQLCM